MPRKETKTRKCIECGAYFYTLSISRWWCDAHKPEPIKAPKPKALRSIED
jgi:hypothetical protein